MNRLSLALFFIVPVLAAAQTFPPGYSRALVGSISGPTAMVFTPDGRIFVTQQTGYLRIFKNGSLLATPFVSFPVNAIGERGLLGIALDPDFVTNQYIYLYYTVPATPPFNRVSRFTANGDLAVPGSEQVILNLDPLSSATNHNGGAIAFGPDGKLYVAVGDNASGPNAQNLNTYHGKLLRINKDGSAPPDNPFYSTGTTEQSKRVWSYGLRNPYTFAIQPGTGRIFVNDVGQSTVEEINEATTPGLNFGWPAAEGPSTNPAYTNPVYSYQHTGAAPIGCAITGGAFFNPEFTTYAASEVGKYFFQDYCSQWIYALDFSGTPTATLFGSGVGGTSLGITAGPDGNLYYLSRGSNALYKVVSTNSTPPVITTQPQPVAIQFGGESTLSVTVSGTAPFTYQWFKDEEPVLTATSAELTLSAEDPGIEGVYKVIVRNIAGQVQSLPVQVTLLANELPVPEIIQPAEAATFVAGDTIYFSGLATDPEDGTLSTGSLRWDVLYFENGSPDTLTTVEGAAGGLVAVPDQGITSTKVYYRIIVTATDSGGATSKDSVDVYPLIVTVTLATDPPGLTVRLEGKNYVTPANVECVAGLQKTLSLEVVQELDESNYTFAEWDHGGDPMQIFSVPSDNVTFTARFALVLNTPEPDAIPKLFPNPASGQLVLPYGEVAGLSICDLTGREWSVAFEQRQQDTIVFAEGLPAGIYVLRFGVRDERFAVRCVIQR